MIQINSSSVSLKKKIQKNNSFKKKIQENKLKKKEHPVEVKHKSQITKIGKRITMMAIF